MGDFAPFPQTVNPVCGSNLEFCNAKKDGDVCYYIGPSNIGEPKLWIVISNFSKKKGRFEQALKFRLLGHN